MSDIVIQRKLQPFSVPNYAIEEARVGKREDGLVETPKHHLSELDEDVLSQLCDQFRADVFARARER